MRLFRLTLVVTTLAAAGLGIADAQPYGPYGYGPAYRSYGYRFGWGPRPYWRRGLSYGTGYRGRGTRTGGPVGGLPSRN